MNERNNDVGNPLATAQDLEEATGRELVAAERECSESAGAKAQLMVRDRWRKGLGGTVDVIAQVAGCDAAHCAVDERRRLEAQRLVQRWSPAVTSVRTKALAIGCTTQLLRQRRSPFGGVGSREPLTIGVCGG